MVVVLTLLVTTVQVTLELPAGIVTLGGIEAIADDPLTILSATDMVVASGFPNVTFPVLLLPPVTEPGVNVTAVGEFAVTVRFAALLEPFTEAETVTVVFADTSVVTTVKVAVLDPVATVTDVGMESTAAFPAVTVRLTFMAPRAAEFRVTVPTLLWPATTLAGTKLNPLTAIGVTVKFPLLLAPFAVPETVTVVVADTFAVNTVKVAEVAPFGTTTEDGIEVTADEPAVTARVTVTSPAAAASNFTVPVLL